MKAKARWQPVLLGNTRRVACDGFTLIELLGVIAIIAILAAMLLPDGSWVNPEPRWWEADPVLVTCYAVMTLEMLEWRMR